MQMCSECHRIYKLHPFTKRDGVYEYLMIDNPKCLDKKCLGFLFDIDELFAPIIAILNKKGYKTLFCCSGHIIPDEEIVYYKNQKRHFKNETIESYIVFGDNIKLPTIPDGYFFDVKTGNLDNTIRKSFNYRKKSKTLLLEIIENTLIVLKWAESLEKLK